MLSLVRSTQLSARVVAKRAIVVAGQRQATVQTLRRKEQRGIQSGAQTDRVS